jgi:hypothetical protein
MPVATSLQLLKRTIPFALLLFLSSGLLAQNKVDGTVLDADDNTPLSGAVMKLTSFADSTQWQAAMADDSGHFEFTAVNNGNYRLQLNYIGYKAGFKRVTVSGTDVHLGTVQAAKNATVLKDVNIVENVVRVEQKNDTSEYNAAAYKTNKDANVEDLVTKMPGITNENGTIKAQGEQVKKVLIDGKEYFGDDAQLAMKNMPSDIVDRVQVFDQMSDQSFFTGFDDGNSQKAMNIITKKGMNKGVFGKVYAGFGYITDARYSAGASINYMDGNRRLSLIGMSNNVNTQNFDMQDLLGVTGSSGGGMRGGMRGGMGGAMRGGRGGGNYGNNASSNFMVGQQGGISTTHSVGLNYSDVFGKRNNFKITGSYFFNYGNNTNRTDLTRQYFNAGDSSTYYKEASQSNSINMNHRVNLRMEYLIDSMNNLIFTPKFSYQQNEQTNSIDGTNTIAQSEFLSRTLSNYQTKSAGYNVSGDLLYQHKFHKLYRTLSVNVGTTVNNKNGNSSQLAVNSFAAAADSAAVDQQATTIGTSYKVYGNLSYTEPAGKTGMVQLSYEPSYTWNKSDKQTLNRDTTGLTTDYNRLDTLLSNKYDNDYMTHKATASYKVKGERFNFTIGVGGQYALLTGVSVFPISYNTNRSFYSVLPNAMFNYRFKNNSNIRIMYRTSTNPPSISQLQSVIDNTNPLLLSTGNPDLKQSYSHFMMVRYGLTNTKTSKSFFAFGSVNYTQNYVGNSTFIATSDTLINNTVTLKAGSQLTRPVNIDGQINANAFLNYGMPITKIKCNINFSTGFTYLRTPSLINNRQNLANTYGVNGGFTLSSNISDKIDFTINYMGTYNIVQNSLQTASNNNYYQHTAGARFNWQFWKGFVFNTNLQNTLYAGIAQGFNQNIFLWNASLGYKFFKDQSLDIRFSVNDILNQNTGVTRTVTETYVEDSKTTVLKRYILLTATYTIKYNKKAPPKQPAGL